MLAYQDNGVAASMTAKKGSGNDLAYQDGGGGGGVSITNMKRWMAALLREKAVGCKFRSGSAFFTGHTCFGY